MSARNPIGPAIRVISPGISAMVLIKKKLFKRLVVNLFIVFLCNCLLMGLKQVVLSKPLVKKARSWGIRVPVSRITSVSGKKKIEYLVGGFENIDIRRRHIKLPPAELRQEMIRHLELYESGEGGINFFKACRRHINETISEQHGRPFSDSEVSGKSAQKDSPYVSHDDLMVMVKRMKKIEKR